MRIICPNCGLKTPVETGDLTVETRLACACCEVEFEFKFTDEQAAQVAAAQGTQVAAAQAVPHASTEIVLFGEAVAPPPAVGGEAEASDVLGLDALPPSPRAESGGEAVLESSKEVVLFDQGQPLVFEQGQAVLEEVETAARASEEPRATAAQPAGADQPTSSDRAEQPTGWEQLDGADEEAEGVVEVAARAHGLGHVPASAVPGLDKYSVGVRLMRVSPMWLLVTGLSFISFIVLCNWFFVPANLAQAEAGRTTARGNQATNQSAPLVAAQAQPAADNAAAREAERPAPTQPAEPAAQLSAQPTADAAPTTPAPSTTPAAEPEPAAEVKSSTPAADARAGGAKSDARADGRFTVQVGAYNVAAEAEARVSSLKGAGFEARSVQVELPKRGTWYRVQTGRFASREEAERHGRQLREKGLAASFLAAEIQ